MWFIFYKKLTKKGHVGTDILSYPDKTAIGYESYAEAEEAGAAFLESGLDGVFWFEARRIY